MKLKKIKPMFTSILTTMDVYSDSDLYLPSGLVDTEKSKVGVKEIQKVIAVGDSVRSIKPGDIVCINPSAYAVRKYSEDSIKSDVLTNKVVQYNFPIVTLNNTDCLLLQDRDIRFVVEEFED